MATQAYVAGDGVVTDHCATNIPPKQPNGGGPMMRFLAFGRLRLMHAPKAFTLTNPIGKLSNVVGPIAHSTPASNQRG